MKQLPVIIYSIKNEYLVIHLGEIKARYNKINEEGIPRSILQVVQAYREYYKDDGLTIDLDNDIYDTEQDALDEYQASYNTNINEILTDSQDTIINTPGTTGTNTMKQQSEKQIRRMAVAKVATGRGVDLVFGTAHFVFQTAADLTVLAEAHIKNKALSFNKEVDELVEIRQKRTAQKQTKAIEVSAKVINATVKPIRKLKGKMSDIEFAELMKPKAKVSHA